MIDPQKTCVECGKPLMRLEWESYCSACLLQFALDDDGSPSCASATETLKTAGSENSRPSQNTFAKLGQYELIERIGQGAMGVVFKARQTLLNRTVALKLLRAGSSATEAEVLRFRKEAEAAATLQHPNIVTIHEVGEEAGRLYFSMDYIEGESMAKLIGTAPLPPARAARYVQTIAEAVHYAHGRGILHRDLKPANVLIDGHDQPLLTDFGLATQLEAESDLTRTGAVLGTPSYMPPEQAAGMRKKIGPASDVYALGAVLYDLVTGRPPFRADTVVDTLRQVMDTEPVPPRLLNPKVPRDVEVICLKCLAKEPAARYSSAQALADDLGRFLSHNPILARPLNRLARVGRWCRRHPAVAVSLSTIVSLLAATTVAALLFASQLERQMTNREVLQNEFLVQQAQNSVLLKFDGWRDHVARLSENETVRNLLETRNIPSLQQRMEQLLVQNEANRFQSWYVEDSQGMLLAVAPFNAAITNKLYNGRDYFRGARTHGDNGLRGPLAVHFSKAFKAENDDKIKFAISAPVYDSGGKFLGIIAATVAADSTLELFNLNDERIQALLLGRWDPNDPRGHGAILDSSEYVLLFGQTGQANTVSDRKKSEFSTKKIVVRHELLTQHQPNCAGDELQPTRILLGSDSSFPSPIPPGKKCLASFAAVGSTEFVIAVQTPLEEVIQLNQPLFKYLAVAGVLALGINAAIAGSLAVISLARARSRREENRTK